MLGSRKWLVCLCLMCLLFSARSTILWANSTELEAIYLDFEIALQLLKDGYPILEENLSAAQKRLLELQRDNESLQNSLAEQKRLQESLERGLTEARQRSFDLENTLIATRRTAAIELRESVGRVDSRARLWRLIAIVAGAGLAVETVVLLFR